jgi:hypothetical protein
MSETIRVLRLIEYEGEREIVEEQVFRSLHGTKLIPKRGHRDLRITAVTLGIYPDVILPEREISGPEDLQKLLRENEKLLEEIQFLRAMPQLKDLEIIHLDGDPTNNSIENLYWRKRNSSK